MGTTFGAKRGMACEVASRTACIYKSIKQNSKILKNPYIPSSSKLNIIRIYLLTAGTFQCSTWPTLTGAQANKFHSAILHCYRVATNQNYNPGKTDHPLLSDEDLLHTYTLESPLALLRRSRLQLLIRIKNKSPSIIINLLSSIHHPHSSSWNHAVSNDLSS